ncbi:hypothetical protein K437DRAFT_221240 [Tilletiaria anomala UBC 951]|uniref:Uncharacterized protein n=1 Tax=Tilletiaria anomala (strain ATCC 24038 / CBS 436.72 / UBC 951) TaxID=1037660 RepID=A0A066WM41_TILAU|nr:uncharacterized protein K437DRAFT_221240 [Tilletiaria anomala UBC 951]KDN52069.1 hypothetical protein K437DRAFT_221240 [Tilletiaria anomala UBC 951]
MAQGFKPAKKPAGLPSSSKVTGKARASSSAQGPKRGKRVIAAKKTAAVKDAQAKRKQTASLTSRVEQEMAGRAASGGPLTIMKKAADGAASEAAKKREKEAKKK